MIKTDSQTAFEAVRQRMKSSSTSFWEHPTNCEIFFTQTSDATRKDLKLMGFEPIEYKNYPKCSQICWKHHIADITVFSVLWGNISNEKAIFWINIFVKLTGTFCRDLRFITLTDHIFHNYREK